MQPGIGKTGSSWPSYQPRPYRGGPRFKLLPPDTEYVIFTVSDTGKGIDAEMQVHLFDHHFSIKRKSFSGLGFPIVAPILHDNEAALWLDSTLGKGTIKTVAWPSQYPDKETRSQIRSAEYAASGLDLIGCNILVFDDLHDVADVLSEMIETTDAMAVAASNPAEALEMLRDNPCIWSALVTDYDMQAVRAADLARTAVAC